MNISIAQIVVVVVRFVFIYVSFLLCIILALSGDIELNPSPGKLDIDSTA